MSKGVAGDTRRPMPYPPVETLIPHRAPHRVVSRVVAVDGPRIVAEADLTPDDVQGHFPGEPVVPGVVMLEGLAQTLACLGALRGEAGRAVLTGVEKARFRGLAVPPCTLRFEVEVTEQRFQVTTARGVVRLDGRVVCSATLQAALLPRLGDAEPA
jgi:3-hydroxyacyl-[acyl-carrier-protein] dehydratase